MTDEIQHSALGRLEFLARGGQGQVYMVPDFRLPDSPSALVYKEYKKDQMAPMGLKAIVSVRSRLDPASRADLDRFAAWPARLVKKGDDVSGVLMPLIPATFFEDRILPSGEHKSSPREIQYLFLDDDRCRRLGIPVVTMPHRFEICRDFARALSMVHVLEVVFGDINAKNALFRVNEEPRVILVDCDAVRIRGSAAVVKQLNAPDWDPPEGNVMTRRTDEYKFGLFVLRCLAPGHFMSTNRDPARAYGALDPEGRRLLEASLRQRPADRTPIAEWVAYFVKRTTMRSRQPVVAAVSQLPPPNPVRAPASWRKDPITGKWSSG